MSISIIITYTLTKLMVAIAPGPASVFVTAQGLNNGMRSSVQATLGVLSCNVLYFTLAAMGIGTLVLSIPALYYFLKVAGALYLCYCGIALVISGIKKKVQPEKANGTPAGSTRFYLQGLALQAANPIAMIFYISMLPQFIDPRTSLWVQMPLLALLSFIPEGGVLLAYGWLATKGGSKMQGSVSATLWKQVLTGTILIVTAAYLLVKK